MEEKPYKEGTIKLTWITKDKVSILNSTMFDNVQEALANRNNFYNGKDWLLMELIKTDGNTYEWKLLPYGDFKSYKIGMHIKDNKTNYLIGISLITVLLYFIFKKNK